jgi:hypothetical protein
MSEEEVKRALTQFEACKDLAEMAKYYPDINFEDEIKTNPQIAEFLMKSIQHKIPYLSDPLANADAPKFNDDFSNYFVISNLPKTEESKVDKLKGILIKALSAKHYKMNSEDIEMPINEETQKTDGVAFVKITNEDNARIGVAIFDGYKMTKKNIFVACLMSEFNKLMETEDSVEVKQLPTLKDLRCNILETKSEQYMYQCGKNVWVNNFSASSA